MMLYKIFYKREKKKKKYIHLFLAELYITGHRFWYVNTVHSCFRTSGDKSESSHDESRSWEKDKGFWLFTRKAEEWKPPLATI